MSDAPADTVFRAWPGGGLDLLSPNSTDIRVSHIAMSLSRVVRYNGWTRLGSWYVSDHCRLMETTLPHDTDPVVRLRVFLSTAHEAYIGNLVAPVKNALAILGGGSAFEHLCARVQTAIYNAAGLPLDPTGEAATLTRLASRMARAIEERDLLSDGVAPWLVPMPDGRKCAAMALPDSAESSRKAFLFRLDNLIQAAGVTPLPEFLT